MQSAFTRALDLFRLAIRDQLLYLKRRLVVNKRAVRSSLASVGHSM